MQHRSYGLCLLAVLATPVSLLAQSGGFVVMLGSDTAGVERYARSGTTIEGEVLRRAPQTTLTRYTIMLATDGSVAKYVQTTTRGDGSALPAGSPALTMTFSHDSVLREIMQNGQPVTLRAAAPKGTLPALPASFHFFQRMIEAARLGRDVFTIGFAAQTAAPVKVDLRLIGRDSAEYVQGGFRTGFRLESGGRIQRADGSLTTQKFIVTAAPLLDIPSIARGWMARDAAGQAFGVASTRDTLHSNVGTAHIILDYGRPARRGREIWGKLVPFDTTWRFGANAAAQLRTDRALDIGGTTIPAGVYSLFLLPSAGQSFLIVNSQTGQWGTVYDVTKDVARIPVEKQPLRAASEERFTVSHEGDQLLMTWDRGGYAVRIREKQ